MPPLPLATPLDPSFLHPAASAYLKPESQGLPPLLSRTEKPLIHIAPEAQDDWSAHRTLLQTAPLDKIKNMIDDRKNLSIPDDVIASAITNPDPFVKIHLIKSYLPIDADGITRCVKDTSDAVRQQIARSNYPLLSSQIMALSLDPTKSVRKSLFDSQRGYTDNEMDFLQANPDDDISQRASHYALNNPRTGQKNDKEMQIAYGKIFLNGRKHEVMYLIKHRENFHITNETMAHIFKNKDPFIRALGIEYGKGLDPEQIDNFVKDKEFVIRRALCRSKIPLTDAQIYQLVGSDNETAALAQEILKSGRPLSAKALDMFRKHPHNKIVLIALQRQPQ